MKKTNNQLIKSKSRIRDHGEVFTPDFIVEKMLDLVKEEVERLDSRFLEPACGEGNFLLKVLAKKLALVEKRYQKDQFNYEKNSLIAVASLYGIELLEDNVLKARKRLFQLFSEKYQKLFKEKANKIFLENIQFILEKNIVQGDALTFKDKQGRAILFSEWEWQDKDLVKRKEFQFSDLATFDKKRPSLFLAKEKSANGEIIFSPRPVKEYPAINFLALKKTK